MIVSIDLLQNLLRKSSTDDVHMCANGGVFNRFPKDRTFEIDDELSPVRARFQATDASISGKGARNLCKI